MRLTISLRDMIRKIWNALKAIGAGLSVVAMIYIIPMLITIGIIVLVAMVGIGVTYLVNVILSLDDTKPDKD